ncbi:MAG: pilus assembly protein PilM [Candidatus Buchananbacteria bacterium]|nr:pilus assembly protein PilM [Candidatus Buchananbacteria bacterium]
MSLFSSSQNSYLGIDFHSNNVKVVELKNENGRPKLVTYGYVDLGFDQKMIGTDKNNQEIIAKVISQVCRQAKTTTINVVSALPAHLVFGSILTLSALPKKQFTDAINKEAEKVIPLPLNQMVLDWKILKNNTVQGSINKNGKEQKVDSLGKVERRKNLKIEAEKKAKTVRILLTAAPREAVKNYINIFKLAKLNLLTLDTEQFSLIRSLVGNDPSALMIVDIGFKVTNVMIVVGGVTFMQRSVEVGGGLITQSIAKRMQVDLSRAEQFKYDLSVTKSQDLKQSVPEDINVVLQAIFDEIKYSLEIYQKQGTIPIEKIILTGGSSLLLNLPEYMSSVFNLKVFRGDPWARVIYPDELKPVLDEIGARFAVSVGLAMRYIE